VPHIRSMGPAFPALAMLLAITACGDRNRVIAPPPDRFAEAALPPPPVLAPSLVDAPIRLDLDTALAVLDSLLPTRFGSLNRRIRIAGNSRESFAFSVRRERFRATFRSDAVLLSTVLHYAGRGWYNPPLAPEVTGSCGTDPPMPRARIAVRLRPELTPDWTLRLHPQLVGLAPVSLAARDRCEVTFLRLDVTRHVLSAARDALVDQLATLDRRVAALDVRGVFADVWREMQHPIRLADSVWLVLDPTGVRAGRLQGSPREVGTTVGIEAHPRIETGARPMAGTTPLPSLGSAGPTQGLNLLVRGRFDYSIASRLLEHELAGVTVDVPGGSVIIKQVRLVGIGGGRIALGLEFRGSAEGRIYFVGRPAYDRATERIGMPDLEIDASTSGLLVRGLAWLRADELRDELRARATFRASDVLSDLTQLAMDGLNRELTPGVRLRAELTGSELLRIDPRLEGLYLEAQVTGSASLALSTSAFLDRPASAPGRD
jgi:Domain of unknown function (DUF4403)